MTDKHMPGQWYAAKGKDEMESIYLIIAQGSDGGESIVAETYGGTAIDEANAALIASAPQLAVDRGELARFVERVGDWSTYYSKDAENLIACVEAVVNDARALLKRLGVGDV